MNKILTIGRESFLLPSSVTEADLLKVLSVFSNAQPIDCDANYLANAETEYSEAVNVLKNDVAPEVEVKLSARRVMARDAYKTAREEGRAEYRRAHPMPEKPASDNF